MTSFPRLILLCLLLTFLAGGAALGQGQQPLMPGPGGYGPGGPGMGAGAGYYGSYGPQHASGGASSPHLGNTSFTINGAVEGLGYQGSYFSVQSTFPIGGMDPLHGWWLIDARINVSERGLPFTNVGLVRRTHFRPLEADFGIGVYHDMDADEYEDFGHTFQQVGISANMWTPHFDVNFNGYVPVGDTDAVQGTADECFFENYIALQHGLDSALTGFEFDFGMRPDWWAAKTGQFNAGVYAYQSDVVDAFAGFRGGFSFQPKAGVRLGVQLTSDDQFDTSGLFQVEFIRGRSRGLSSSGRDLDPMRRNAHIVRAHQDPILATNPVTNELYRVVHVDNSAPDGGDGTFENPFNELSDADGTLPPFIVDGGLNGNRFREQPRSLPFDIIFVNEGLSRDFNGTPLNPNDDLPGDLTGYDTGIALLEGQMFLGDGVQHIIPTVEKGNYILCNDIDGLTPYISNGIHFPTPTSGTQPDRAAVTLANDTTVRGFNIVNSEIGILAPDPTPNANNNDGVMGDIVLERINIFQNNQFDVNDLVRNTGDDVDPDTATIDVPLKYGISILDSTAMFSINNVNIKGQNVILPVDIFDDGAGGTRVINFTPNGNLVAALNVERGMPDINFNGTINNEFKLIQQVVVDDGDPLTIDPILNVEFDTLSAGGRALRVVDTTGGTQFIDGLINNVMGQGIMIDNADDTMITVDSMVMIDQSTTPSITITDSDDSFFAFTNQVLITDPEEAGVLLTDNTDTEITFFDLQITTPENQAALDAGLVLPNSPVTGFLAQRNSGGMTNVTGKSFIDIVGGPALSLAGVDGDETPVDLNFTRLRSVASADGGVNLANISGTVRSTRTTVIDSASTAIVATSNDGDPLFVDFGQTTINPSAGDAAAGIDPGQQAGGVFLQNNTGSRFSFDQLLVTTGNGDPTMNTNIGGAAFRAIGGGAINFNSVPVLTAVGGPVLELRNVTGTFQNAPGLVFNDLTTIQRNGAGIIIDGVTNDVLIQNANIPNDRGTVDPQAGGGAIVALDPAPGNAIDILNTSATGSRVTVVGSSIDTFANTGINIVDSIATIQAVDISAPNEVLIFDTPFTAPITVPSTAQDGISVTATNGNFSRVQILDNTVRTINGSGLDVSVANNGTVEVAVSGNTFQSLNGSGAVIDGSSGGTLIVTELSNNTIGAIPADPADPTTIVGTGGILVTDVTFDADVGLAGLQQVQGGNTVIGNQNLRVRGTGLSLQDVEGELYFKNLNIFNDSGTGLLVKNPDTDFLLVTGGGNINTTNGAAIDIDPTTVDMKLNSVTSTNASNTSSGPAIHLDDVRGELFIDRTTIVDAGTGIEVTNSINGFEVNFGDTAISGTGTQGDGVVLRNNDTALIEFQGLDIQTDSGSGFYVRDGGTVNFRGESATVIANNGNAVDIDELTRGQTDGVAGWTFNTITLNNAAGATGGSAVRLNNIADDFRVTGNVNINANGEAGIFINGGESDIRIGQVNSTNRLAVGIQIEDIGGTVRIASANIGNANGVAGNAINIIDTYTDGRIGNVGIYGGLITDAENDGVHIENSIATIANMSIRAPNATEKHDGISVVTNGINDAIVLLQDNTVFLDDGDVGVRLLSNGTGTLNATVLDNLLRGNETLDPLVDNIASIHATSASGTLFLNAVDNHDGDGTSPTNPIRLENLGGTLDVTQTSAGNLSALNNNVDVEVTGVVGFGAGTPPEPPPVPAN